MLCLPNESETKAVQEGASPSFPLDESFTKQREELIGSDSTGKVIKNQIQDLNVQIKELTDCSSIYEKELNAANKAIRISKHERS